MGIQYRSIVEELDDLYFSIYGAIDNIEELNSNRDLNGAQRQAIIIVRGIDRIRTLLETHPNRIILERQIGQDLKNYEAQATEAIFSCESRGEGEIESPESRAFWLDLYEHTTVPY